MFYLSSIPASQAVVAIAGTGSLASATTTEAALKRNLKWTMHQGIGMPSLTLPTVSADDERYVGQKLAISSNLPGNAAAFLAPNLLNQALGLSACNPGAVLDTLGPNILRSHIPTAQHKPIPYNDDVDLEAFRRKDPREWSMDDVIGWMISVAKRRGIPVEDMNMHRFATCTGPLLTLMSQQNFIERDPTYGGLLYVEFRKLMGDDASSFLDDWIRLYRDELEAGTSGLGATTNASSSAAAANATAALLSSLAAANEVVQSAASAYRQQVAAASASMVASDQPCTSRQDHSQADIRLNDVYGRSGSFSQRESVIKAAGSSNNIAGHTAPSAINHLGSLPDLCKLKTGNVDSNDNHGDGSRFGLKFGDNTTRISAIDGTSLSTSVSASTIPKFPDGKIVKKKANEGSCSLTISGKPRKRSQHTRGNKLWEFIRSSLRDPRTCPSIVKWEDESEGVFRIVESEKLARLWGEKKNNQKMTYEKLSRAMRTYYEKQILVPVPKTGLYPKKLVYKFGPNAKGWQNPTPTNVMASIKIARPDTKQNSVANPTFPLCPPMGQSAASMEKAQHFLSKMGFVNGTNQSNGLLSLADVASRQLAADNQVIDIDGHSDTGDCVSAIDEDEDELDIDDTPPTLVD